MFQLSSVGLVLDKARQSQNRRIDFSRQLLYAVIGLFFISAGLGLYMLYKHTDLMISENTIGLSVIVSVFFGFGVFLWFLFMFAVRDIGPSEKAAGLILEYLDDSKAFRTMQSLWVNNVQANLLLLADMVLKEQVANPSCDPQKKVQFKKLFNAAKFLGLIPSDDDYSRYFDVACYSGQVDSEAWLIFSPEEIEAFFIAAKEKRGG